ncbi:MAG: bifunctional diaminohydroxyphosphoribosylaminopyrimidine deaminase/5-amino-6-(5-phosphoribosylamino)uracil reductase RibD [Hyphomicrobiales bacterium]|nr:bifunctional diaminohydroxyphosphoribosylaminopyrimidine deaminase/5-amino-6-(5-phosphoribosylamino)uracil reductase RibD [Hyphomicrobiales bacterium]
MTPGDDRYLMGVALMLARRVLGEVAPNPAVGCVLARKEKGSVRIIARSHTSKSGRPHAETQALKSADGKAENASMYVTLEPCAHTGETPPCVDAIIAAGVSRVVYALGDPDPRVSGRGRQRLEDAGIKVESGVLREEAEQLNAGYLMHRTRGRPLVILKVASSLDGCITSPKSRWVTGKTARRRGHLLRAMCDGILIGSECAMKDDPMLTCRLPGMESRSPVRIVADGRLRLPLESQLPKSADEAGLWILTRAGSSAEKRKALEKHGVILLDVPEKNGRLDISKALELLAGRGITRLLVEGGARLATSFLRAGLVDRVEWFRAPVVFGEGGLPAFGDLCRGAIPGGDAFISAGCCKVGEDTHETYVSKRNED